ncbi:MAG: hypothetical protein HY072_08680 [Deltaproteobacteria bacterium]|nr:hypothetical protein [Deltaproteobacteria bacterium]
MSLNKAGTYTLVFSSPGLTSAETDSIEVSTGSFYQIDLSGLTLATRGTASSPIVYATDKGGNYVDPGAVTFALSAMGGKSFESRDRTKIGNGSGNINTLIGADGLSVSPASFKMITDDDHYLYVYITTLNTTTHVTSGYMLRSTEPMDTITANSATFAIVQLSGSDYFNTTTTAYNSITLYDAFLSIDSSYIYYVFTEGSVSRVLRYTISSQTLTSLTDSYGISGTNPSVVSNASGNVFVIYSTALGIYKAQYSGSGTSWTATLLDSDYITVTDLKVDFVQALDGVSYMVVVYGDVSTIAIKLINASGGTTSVTIPSWLTNAQLSNIKILSYASGIVLSGLSTQHVNSTNSKLSVYFINPSSSSVSKMFSYNAFFTTTSTAADAGYTPVLVSGIYSVLINTLGAAATMWKSVGFGPSTAWAQLASFMAIKNYDNSRIRDEDCATETTACSKNQILIQAGKAMLAQANSMPQFALQLIR